MRILTSNFLQLLAFPLVALTQPVEVLDFSRFEASYLHRESDTTYVLNFWATWCKPCVAEMPAFLEVESQMSKQQRKVQFIFVTLDDVENLERKVKPFLKSRNITSTMVLLDDVRYNTWIDKVSTDWSGAIPATLVYNHSKKKREFYERDFNTKELTKTLKPFLN